MEDFVECRSLFSREDSWQDIGVHYSYVSGLAVMSTQDNGLLVGEQDESAEGSGSRFFQVF